MPQALPDEVFVLILGGTTHLSRSLLKWLINPAKDVERPGVKIKHVRLADKYLVSNGASTIWTDPDTYTALSDPRVEYCQVNLNSAAGLSKTYDNPNGGSYDLVFDFTGEGVNQPDVPEPILLERTAKLAKSIALESQRRGVKAHIRDTVSFLAIDVGDPPVKESDIVKPKSARAYWWYEAERAAASVPDLPLAITRSAEIVGPWVFHGSIASRYAFGHLYRYLKEPLKFLWGPELRIHAIHIDDWCPAAWKIAEWVASRSRSEADQLAGENLPPVRMKDKLQDTLRDKVGAECCPRTTTPCAPVFNLVDDTDLNQGKLLSMIGETYGIETGFANTLINTWARLNLKGIAEELNAKHHEAFFEIMADTGAEMGSLKGWIDVDVLENQSHAWDNAKVKRVIGWRPKVTIDRGRLDEIIDGLRRVNHFPDRDHGK